MQLKNVEINVYRLDNEAFEPIGQINQFTSLIWPDSFNSFATFELNVPVTQENKTLIKKGNILWCGKDNACIIEIITSKTDEEGQKTLQVKGRTLEMLLTTRIIWGTYDFVGSYASTAMYEIVNTQCVNPSQENRKIPWLECAEDEEFGDLNSYQKTGGEVYDAIQTIAINTQIGFCILFRPKQKKLIFKAIQGVDRSNSVVFSTELDDILSSSYYTNNQDMKSTAYIAGEGLGVNRTYVVSGDNASPGFLRREMYVDARDLQSETTDEEGNTIFINADDYRDMLNERGKQKLAEYEPTESFEVQMRVIGNIQYKYGVDYFKGDKVLIQDTDIGIQVIGTVSEISENYDDEYELVITFGYSYPTLIQKIKRQFL